METIKFKAGALVKLKVNISSDANVGSNVSLNDRVVKKSITNNFYVELGVIDNIDGQVLSVVSNFFVKGGNIDTIMETTHVVNTVYSDSTSKEISSDKVKLSPALFTAYSVVELKKI
ncbi:hypothetical protein [uncultured Winogradskyella sp.]|uniref:hypothetical protein n=1 Tax=uncultured Winogradskyella sp. TaxID=395353 RepID=UPI002601B14A|nr:hypothetical protein [uncultured Winogradskyella sp.]